MTRLLGRCTPFPNLQLQLNCTAFGIIRIPRVRLQRKKRGRTICDIKDLLKSTLFSELVCENEPYVCP